MTQQLTIDFDYDPFLKQFYEITAEEVEALGKMYRIKKFSSERIAIYSSTAATSIYGLCALSILMDFSSGIALGGFMVSCILAAGVSTYGSTKFVQNRAESKYKQAFEESVSEFMDEAYDTLLQQAEPEGQDGACMATMPPVENLKERVIKQAARLPYGLGRSKNFGHKRAKELFEREVLNLTATNDNKLSPHISGILDQSPEKTPANTNRTNRTRQPA